MRRARPCVPRWPTDRVTASLERFGQGTKLGVYRYLLLSMTAYLLSHSGHLSQGREGLPPWGVSARTILEEVLPQTVIEGLLMEIEKRSTLLQSNRR